MVMKRIGVFICHCGRNIAGTVDVEKVAKEIGKREDVVFSTTYVFMCSQPGQKLIEDSIKEYNLDGVVVANCSPTLHERTMRNAAARAGLNPYRVEIANIREWAAWPHEDNPEAATRKAIRIIHATIEKLKANASLVPVEVPVTRRALVIGGGVAGIQAALDLADAGIETVVVERNPSLGGNMIRLSETFPTLDCPQCILTPKMNDVGGHPNIKLYTYSEVEEVEGYLGNFTVKIRKKSPFIDWNKCTGCGECAKVCPTVLPSDFDLKMATRKATHIPFEQAVPFKYTITYYGEPPCNAACPLHLNAQGYVAAAKAGDFERSLNIVREKLPFAGIAGRICTHPCEDACSRGKVDKPVGIREIKRFVADWELKKKGSVKYRLVVDEEKDKSVAIIGAGAAGLMAAHDLRKMGYKVTVYDKLPVIGGMLAIGIPPYRLPQWVIDAEVQPLIDAGVEFVLNYEVNEKNFEEIRKKHDAVIIAIGTHRERKLNIKGEELDGVLHAVEFLKKVNLGERIDFNGKKVVVIGGGNSAIDAARSALRLGGDVTIAYRRVREMMPAIPEEVVDAEEEGVKFEFLASPVEILGDGKVKGIKLARMKLGEKDESGRRRPIPTGEEFVIDADIIIVAIGEVPDTSFVEKLGIEVERNRIKTDKYLRTSLDGVFAAGDSVTGAWDWVHAAAYGRFAAKNVAHYLQGEEMEEVELSRTSTLNGFPEIAYPAKRHDTMKLSIEERVSTFKEFNLGYSEEDVVDESKRCLGCGGCAKCGICIDACDVKAIDLNMADQIVEEKVGAIVVATGFEVKPAEAFPELGGNYPDVITALQFERLLAPSGPTAGIPRRPSDGKVPKKVAFLHCVGSRDPALGVPYCSRICCMYLIKQATLYKHAVHDGEAYAFYIDIRSNGKGYEEFYQRSKEEYGVVYIRGKVGKVYKVGDKYRVQAVDTLTGRVIEVDVDMVVLATAAVGSSGVKELAKKLRIPYDEWGWLKETHLKLRPLETPVGGVFIAGAAQFVKDITDSVSQASGAAAKAMALLSKQTLEKEPLIAKVNTEICAGCGRCKEACAYGAITIDPIRHVSVVNEALCEGCGACSANCPTTAIEVINFKKGQVVRAVDILAEVL